MIRQSKFNAAMASMSSIAKKVYDATPVSEPWKIHQIIGEMTRNGVSGDYRICGGAMNTLIESGLVIEPSKGCYIRVLVKEPAEEKPKQPEPTPVTPTPANTAKPAATPLEMFGTIAARARTIAADMKALASDIETAALNVETVLEEKDKSAGKLKQLQALLKGLGD